MAQRSSITTPVGRIVMGSLYKGSTTDAEGKTLVVKNGPNAGQSRTNYFFALAIPKGTERHWAETPWGAEIWKVGHTAFPNAAQAPSFAWKIEDGDSTIPNKRGRKPVENEGWAGHWILKFSGGFAPKVYRKDGTALVQALEEGYVKPGYFAQVYGTIDGNGSQTQPGIYLNHTYVCFSAYGAEISFGPDVNEAGFGQSPLPAGASLTPPASSIPLPATGAIAGASTVAAIPPAPAVTSSVASAPPIPVTPNPAFLQVPAVPALPTASAPVTAVPAPPSPTAIASPSKAMTAKAAGASYESFIAGGWTEANMVARGYMTV
jgi:hypothetical protein